MTRDLSDLMNDAVSAREATLSDSPLDAVAARTRRGVRRRRAWRHTYEAGGAVAVASVIGLGGWWGTQREAPVPADTPSPQVTSPSPTPSVTPSPSASSTPTPEPTQTTVPPVPPTFGQPTSEPVTPQVWSRVKAGWSVTLHQPTYTPADEFAPVATSAALYLVSPAGERYHLLDLPSGTGMSLVHWKAGTSKVLVQRWETATYEWLDLRTGATTPSALPDGSMYAGVDAAGRTIYGNGFDIVAVGADGTPQTLQGAIAQISGPLSPSRTHAFLQGGGVFDLAAAAKKFFYIPQGMQSCGRAIGWLSDAQVAMACTDGSGTERYFVTQYADYEAVGTVPAATPLYDGLGFNYVQSVDVLPDGKHVVTGSRSDRAGTFVVDGTTVTPLVTTDHSMLVEGTVVGSLVFTRMVYEGETQDPEPRTYVVRDVRNGREVELATTPTDTGEQYGLGPIVWLQGMTEAVVATAY